jgi:hypothetical protein
MKLNGAASGHEVDNQDYNRNNQQQVNETAADV